MTKSSIMQNCRIRAAGIVLLNVVCIAFCCAAIADPTGEQVVQGDVNFTRSGDLTLIRAGDNSIINYSGFSIRPQETVQFVQPGATSRVLNRVLGPDPSQIDGMLLANGIVYIVNPAGVYFGNGALVNVGGIYTAAGTITDQDFLANINHFSDLAGTVTNYGIINANAVNLIGLKTANFGSIVAPNGLVTMSSGKDIYLGDQDSHIMVKIDGGDAAAQDAGAGVENAGTIDAGKGTVRLGAGDIYSLAIRNTGTVKAQQITIEGGSSGLVHVSGSLDASSSDGPGGTVKVLGDKVALTDARIDASGSAGGGTVLVGGSFQGGGPERNASRTWVDKASFIASDALIAGDGGTVIVWGNDYTLFEGAISARGGANAGNGGFVEVSAKENLNFAGTVNLLAPSGNRGKLLLDPKNIDVATGGGADIADVIDFTLTPGDDKTIDPDNIKTILDGADVELQANNNITVTNGFDASSNGTPGNLSLRAGNSIFINDSISLNGSFSATANDPGANAGDRDTGSAVFTMNGTAVINTSAGPGDITIRMDTGAGGGQDSGDITINGLAAGAGNVLVQNNGTTAGSDILRVGGSSTISAESAALQVAATDGAIGLQAEPVRVTATNFEAAAGAGGVYIISPSQGITLGGAALGGLTGVSTTGGGSIEVSTQAGGITVSESVDSAADVTLDAASGIHVSTGTVDATDNITLQAAEDVQLDSAVGATTGNQISIAADHDGDGSGTFTSNAGGTVGSATAGSVMIASNGIVIGDTITSGTSITLQPSADATEIGINDNGGFSLLADELTKLTAPAVTIGRSAGTGTTTIGTVAALDLSPSTSYDLTLRGGPVLFNDSITLADNKTLTINNTGDADGSNAGADVIIGGGSGTLSIASGGMIDLDTQIGILSGANANGNIDIANNSSLQVTGPVSSAAGNGDIILDAGTGTLTNTGTISAGAGNIALTADELDIQAGISGTGTLELQPSTANRSIGIGEGAAGDFNLGSAELANLVDGSSSITVGRADGQHDITVRSELATPVNFNDPLVLRSPNGGTFSQTGAYEPSITAPSITFDLAGPISLSKGLTTLGGDLIFNAGITIEDGKTILLDTGVGGGYVTISGAVNGTLAGAGENLTISAGTGGISLGVIGDLVPLGLVDPNTSGTATFNGNVTADDVQIDGLTGSVVIGADTTLTSSGDHDFDFSNATGIDGASDAAQAFGIVTSGTGAVSLPAVGAGTTLGSVSITTGGSGVTTLNGDIFTDNHNGKTGNVTILGGSTTLATDLQIDTDAANNGSGGSVDLSGTAVDGTQDLAIVTGDGSVGLGAVGHTTPLGSLSVTSSGSTMLGASIYTDDVAGKTGDVTVGGNGTVIVSADVTINTDGGNGGTGGQADLNGCSIVSAANGVQNFAISTADGDVALGNLGAPGAALGSVLVTTSGTTRLAGDIRTDNNAGNTGNVVINGGGPVVLTANAAVNTDSGGDGSGGAVSLQNTTSVNGGGNSLAISAGSGTINLPSMVNFSLLDLNASGAATFNGHVAAADIQVDGLTGSLLVDSVTFTATNNAIDLSHAAGIDGLAAGVQDLIFVAGSRDVKLPAVGASVPLGSLHITSSGNSVFGGSIRTDNVSSTGNVTVDGGGTVTLAGNIMINTDAGADSTGGTVDLSATTVNGTSAGNQHLFIQTANAPVNLGAIGTSTALGSVYVTTSGAVTLAGDIRTEDNSGIEGYLSMPGGGVLNIATNVTINTDANGNTIAGSVDLTGRSSIVGGNNALRIFTGDDTISLPAAAGLSLLDLNASGTTTFNGDVTATDIQLDGLTGSVVVGASTKLTSTDNDIDLSNATKINGTTVGGQSLEIVPGDAIAKVPSVGVDVALSDLTVGGREIQLIGQNSYYEATTTITFSAAPATVPDVATIFNEGGNLTVDTGTFRMGNNDKMTVVGRPESGIAGNLSISAANGAYIGDLNALGDITVQVSAPGAAIHILKRDSGDVRTTLGGIDRDRGVDYVAGGTITFTGTIVEDNVGNRPEFANSSGSGAIGTYSWHMYGPIDVATFSGSTLDLRAQGPTNTNVSEALAGAAPRQQAEVPQVVGLDLALREVLELLGIYVRTLSFDELMGVLGGLGFYDDLPQWSMRVGSGAGPDPALQPWDYKISPPRISASVALRAIDSYNATFFKDGDDQTSEIADELQKAIDDYKTAAEAKAFDGTAFTEHLVEVGRATGATPQALVYMAQLHGLLNRLAVLGLTPLEYANCKEALLRNIVLRTTFDGINIKQLDLEKAIEVTPLEEGILEADTG